MGTSEKLNKLITTKNAIKSALETSNNKFADYSSLITKYVANQPTATDEEKICKNAVDLPIKSCEINGNSKQNKTNGTNLCNLNVSQNSRITYNQDGTITINGNGGINLKWQGISLEANTTYYLKWQLVSGTIDTSASEGNAFMNPFTSSGWILEDRWVSYTPTSSKTINASWINAAATFSNAVIKIWISKTQSDWEPYTNGASPNPNYPQEIKVVNNHDSENIYNLDDGSIGLIQSDTNTFDSDNTKIYSIPLNGNCIAKVGTVKDKLKIYRSGKVELVKNINHIASYNGESITTDYISSTGQLTTGAEVYYVSSTSQTIELPSITPIYNYEGTNNFELISNIDSDFKIEYVQNFNDLNANEVSY